jgi:hypothetical protein
MGSWLNLDIAEEIDLIEIDAPTDTQLVGVNVLESQNSNAPELPIKRRKKKGVHYLMCENILKSFE